MERIDSIDDMLDQDGPRDDKVRLINAVRHVTWYHRLHGKKPAVYRAKTWHSPKLHHRILRWLLD